MSIRDEQQASKEIAELLPPGYVKTIPFDIAKDVSFEFGGITVKMSALYYNEPLNCYMFDLAWGAENKIYGIPIRCGLDILQQYTTPLPNMYAANLDKVGTEVTSWRHLYMFVIDEGVLNRVQP